MTELQEGASSKLYYEGAGQEALDKWKAMSQQERNAAKSKNDEIDGEKTSDLEKPDGEDNEEEDMNEITLDFFQQNRINLARAFLGYDGGYSIRKLKKFMRRDKKRQQLEDAEEKTSYGPRRDDADDDDGAPAEEINAAATEEAGEIGAEAEDNAPYSDESDIDEILKVIDDESFEKLIQEAKAEMFTTEEEAKVFFEDKIKSWAKTRVKKRKVVVD